MAPRLLPRAEAAVSHFAAMTRVCAVRGVVATEVRTVPATANLHELIKNSPSEAG